MLNIKQILDGAEWASQQQRQRVLSFFYHLRRQEARLDENQRFSLEQNEAYQESIRLLNDEEELFGDEDVDFIAQTYQQLRRYVSARLREQANADEHEDDMEVDRIDNFHRAMPGL